MLLYPHHADLRQREGRIGRHRINGSEDWLATATIDVSTGRGFLERLQAIEDIAVVMENGSQFARNSFQAETY
jgi:hypothetical protein